jgi:hypothetical protein
MPAIYRTDSEIQKFRNPPIGTIVHWFPRANPDDIASMAPGIITAIEGPGIVSMTVFRRAASPLFIYGARHVSDPFHIDKRESTMRNGGWDFIPAYRPDQLMHMSDDFRDREFDTSDVTEDSLA